MTRGKKVEVNVYNVDTHRYAGTIKRTPERVGSFGPYDLIRYSIGGKRYKSVGGQDLFVSKSVILWLKKKGELKKIY